MDMEESAFGVNHLGTGLPPLREEYSRIGKSMAGSVVGGGKNLVRAARTPKGKKLTRASQAGRAAASSTTKFGGPSKVPPNQFDSLPSRMFPNKRKAWERGYYGGS